MSVFHIPLHPGTPQTMSIVLGGVPYTLTLQYRNAPGGGWILDLADGNNNPILSGVPLVTGVDLLEQYVYLGLNGGLRVLTSGDVDLDETPTFDNLGVDAYLYWVSP